MRVSIIAAMARNCVIGTETGLPWYLPRDLKQFRSLTMGKPVVLGRKTLEHIGHALPGRANVVLSRRRDYSPDGVSVAHSVQEALAIAEVEANRLKSDEVMVIGGGEVYRAFLPETDRVYLTIIDKDFAGNATFPLDLMAGLSWVETERSTYPADEKNSHAYTFHQLDRAAAGAANAVEVAALLGAA